MEFLNDLTILGALKLSILLILADTLFGWINAFIMGIFELDKAPQFIVKNVLPYIGGLLILAGFAYVENWFRIPFFIAVGFVNIKFGKDVVMNKIRGLFGTKEKG